MRYLASQRRTSMTRSSWTATGIVLPPPSMRGCESETGGERPAGLHSSDREGPSGVLNPLEIGLRITPPPGGAIIPSLSGDGCGGSPSRKALSGGPALVVDRSPTSAWWGLSFSGDAEVYGHVGKRRPSDHCYQKEVTPHALTPQIGLAVLGNLPAGRIHLGQPNLYRSILFSPLRAPPQGGASSI